MNKKCMFSILIFFFTIGIAASAQSGRKAYGYICVYNAEKSIAVVSDLYCADGLQAATNHPVLRQEVFDKFTHYLKSKGYYNIGLNYGPSFSETARSEMEESRNLVIQDYKSYGAKVEFIKLELSFNIIE